MQFFMNAACTEGFLCTNDIADAMLYDGCLMVYSKPHWRLCRIESSMSFI